MRYVVIRNARFDSAWEPGARLAAGEILLVSDSLADCQALIPRPLSAGSSLVTFLSWLWQGNREYWERCIAEAEARMRDGDEVPWTSWDLEYSPYPNDPARTLRCGRAWMECHAGPASSLLEWLTRNWTLDRDDIQSALAEVRQRMAESMTADGDDGILQSQIDELEARLCAPDAQRVAELEADPDLQFEVVPERQANSEPADQERFGETFTLGVVYTRAEELFDELAFDHGSRGGTPGVNAHHWVRSALYEDVLERLVRLPDDDRTMAEVRREIRDLESWVMDLADLSEQEIEWLIEDRMK